MTARTEIMNLKVKDMGQLEETLARFDVLRARIPSFDSVTGMEIVRRLVKELKRCATRAELNATLGRRGRERKDPKHPIPFFFTY